MEPETIYDEIQSERERQTRKYGDEFDRLNTRNDWVTYITFYASRCAMYGRTLVDFRASLIKVAGMCVAAIERIDADEVAPRHYDPEVP